SYDEVEDIRLAVGEACTRSIDRLNGSQGDNGHAICLRCLIDSNRLTIEVRNPLVPAAPRPEPLPDVTGAVQEQDLSGVLIRILMDEVESEDVPEQGVQILRMVKYVAR